MPVIKEVVVKCTRCHTEIRMNEQASQVFHGGQYTVRSGRYAERHDEPLFGMCK